MGLSYETRHGPMSHWISWVNTSEKVTSGTIARNIFLGVLSLSKLRSCDKHISYTCVRENVIEGLKNIGVDTKLFGLHSLRAAGATAAANLGVNDRPF